MTSLPERLKRVMVGDRDKDSEAAIGGRKVFANHDTYQFIQGVNHERNRTARLDEALVKCVNELVRANIFVSSQVVFSEAMNDIVKGAIRRALADLETVVQSMEE